MKAALREPSEQKSVLAETVRQIEEIDKQLKEITDDQARLRQNLDKVPKESECAQTLREEVRRPGNAD